MRLLTYNFVVFFGMLLLQFSFFIHVSFTSTNYIRISHSYAYCVLSSMSIDDYSSVRFTPVFVSRLYHLQCH